MSCHHRFFNELSLNEIDYDPKVLIVGTFNPSWPEENYAEWFYGRVSNNYFWDLLPAMYNEIGLRQGTITDWKAFCQSKEIAITDLLEQILDADINNEEHNATLLSYSDSQIATRFKQHVLTNIIPILFRLKSIKEVYLTTTAKNPFWGLAWKPIEEYCIQNGLWCQKLMTPSKNARFQMKRGAGISLPDFIYRDWKSKWKVNT